MPMRVRTLSVQFRRSFEVVEFGQTLTFFHGKVGSGKSSIARLVDFCLGGDLQLTPALSAELVAAHLDLELCGRSVLLERNREQQGYVQVTWSEGNDLATTTMLVPTDSVPEPLFDNVHGLSDLLFWLCGITPPKVRRNATDPEAPMIRLSFRDLWVYCYLRQQELDSSFFKLEAAFRMKKSRDAMLFVTGLQNEAISEIEAKIADLGEKRNTKENTLHEVRGFLRSQGISDSIRLSELIAETETELQSVVGRLEGERQDQQQTHPVDELRTRLRMMSEQLDSEKSSLRDLQGRMNQQQQLIAEYRSMKMKLLREGAAERLLGRASFSCCPSCGKELEPSSGEACILCGGTPTGDEEDRTASVEVPLRDLDQRIHELDLSIGRVEDALHQQELRVDTLEAEKRRLDAELAVEARAYDSVYLARIRGLEAQRARLEEHVRGLRQLLAMHQGLSRLVDEIQNIAVRQDELKERLASERQRAAESERFVIAVEGAYHEALLSVGVPGVNPQDKVKINRRTWIPYVQPEGDKTRAWSFYNAGSGGKMTLMNVCYALALHTVAQQNDLPLPSVLVIDTPMKNITEDVNREIFEQFYRYLYSLLAGPLAGTQVVLIDNSLIEPSTAVGGVVSRYMTPDEPDHPPLIPYYTGP